MAKNHEELHFRCRIPIELIRHTNDRESPSGISAPAMAHILEKLALMLAPFAPYLSQEIWEELGNSGPAFRQSWPAFDPELAKEDLAEVVVQVNGKLRGRIYVAFGTPKEDLERGAMADEKVQAFLAGKQVIKVITVPDKLVNVVVSKGRVICAEPV